MVSGRAGSLVKKLFTVKVIRARRKNAAITGPTWIGRVRSSRGSAAQTAGPFLNPVIADLLFQPINKYLCCVLMM